MIMSLQRRKITIDKIAMLVMAGAVIGFMIGFAVAVTT